MTNQNDIAGILSAYDYVLPDSQIARAPASPRDSAKLLLYNNSCKELKHEVFSHLPALIPQGALLVFNQTKVVPARLSLTKDSGAEIEVLVLHPKDENVLALTKGRVRPGMQLSLNTEYFFTVVESNDTAWLLRPSFPLGQLNEILSRFGATPLPPYIGDSPLTEEQRRKEYQTVFAKIPGSAAAPTASLHFTEELITRLQKKGIEHAFITLHVGLGTFAPLKADQLMSGKLHEEWYEISQEAAQQITQAKREGRPVIAVGTTVVRTLESAVDHSGALTKLAGTTNLFIRPGYQFKVVDQLLTNFHVPKSSLMMLVAAMIGRETLLELYAIALRNEYRFLSFGDAMYIT